MAIEPINPNSVSELVAEFLEKKQKLTRFLAENKAALEKAEKEKDFQEMDIFVQIKMILNKEMCKLDRYVLDKAHEIREQCIKEHCLGYGDKTSMRL